MSEPTPTPTPTPWKLAGIPDNMIVCDAEGGSIADCAPPGPWMRDKEALSNAAFIVKCVNSHDALVEALATIADIAEGSGTLNSFPNIAKISRAALASIKETTP